MATRCHNGVLFVVSGTMMSHASASMNAIKLAILAGAFMPLYISSDVRPWWLSVAYVYTVIYCRISCLPPIKTIGKKSEIRFGKTVILKQIPQKTTKSPIQKPL